MDFLETRFHVREFVAFQAWYRRSVKRLPYCLDLHEATDNHLVFGIRGVHPAISLVVRTSGFDILVNWQGVNWDMLISFDFEALQTDTGYRCGFCTGASGSARFASLDAFWELHCFEAIASWLQDQLEPATWLYLNGRSDHYTFAQLSTAIWKDDNDAAAFVLLVHPGHDTLDDH